MDATNNLDETVQAEEEYMRETHHANLSELLTGNFSRLRFITRFSNCPRLHDESVAEHSYYTTLYAYAIAKALNLAGYPVDAGETLGKALMHDADECFSGDFIRMFKHHNPIVKKAIDETCTALTAKLGAEIASSAELAGKYFYDWLDAKKGVSGRIVAFADYLSVLSYISQELELGNIRMRRQLPELRKFHLSFRRPEFEFISVYVDEAGIILKNLEDQYK